MGEREEIVRLFISQIAGITCSEARLLEERLHCSDLQKLGLGDIEMLIRRRLLRTRSFDSHQMVSRALEAKRFCKEEQVRQLSIGHEGYPKLLRQIYDPPYLLFVRGSLEWVNLPCILAVVGTRKAGRIALRSSYAYGRQAALAGIPLVSGLARGVDSAAGQGCVDAGGASAAVLGSGLGRIYPRSSLQLARNIVRSGGALVSEYLPFEPPQRWHFPQRNRIISGMSCGVLVTEAPKRSGALITADFALEQGRDVWVDACSLQIEAAEGTRELHEQGAPAVDGVAGIFPAAARWSDDDDNMQRGSCELP